MAIHSLNALVGSIDVPGGVTVFQELSLLENGEPSDEAGERGLANPPLDGPLPRRRLCDSAVDLLADSIKRRQPYPAEALFLVDADPIFSLAEGKRLGEALSTVPFVVSFSGYPNDSTQYADLILPLLHGLHRWDFNTSHTLKGHPVVSISQPVMDSSGEVRDPYGVLRAIAQSIGGTTAQSLPWPDGKAAVDAVLGELFHAGKGAAFGPANEESWAQLLESRGWRAPFAERFVDFKRDVLSGGGWTDPIYFHREWDRVFRSPSHKFAFSSLYLERSFEAAPDPGDSPNLERRCLPNCPITVRQSDGEYPLDLYVYPLPALVSVSSSNLPWLNDIAGAYMFEKWRTWVEVHPETASRYGLKANDRVEIRTPRGRLVLPLKIYAGLMPEVIAIPFGFGHKFGGRWCAGIGENPAELVDARTDPLTGAALWTATRASISRV